MSETTSPPPPAPAPRQLPLRIAGRSLFDRHRLQLQGAGNILLAVFCIFGAGGAGGITFGILFFLLAIATWIIAFQHGWDWYAIPPDYRRGIVAVGASIGATSFYIVFGVIAFVVWVFMHIAEAMELRSPKGYFYGFPNSGDQRRRKRGQPPNGVPAPVTA